jgi:hypothetical protein
MKTEVKTVQDAFKLDNLDPNNITITGVPERHVEALKAMAKLFVIHDALNPTFQPDYTKVSQRKFNPLFTIGSPSGVGFSFFACDLWHTGSDVGSRLVSESSEITKYIAETFSELYKEVMVYERKIK